MITNFNYSLFPNGELLTFAKGTITLADARKAQLNTLDPFVVNVVTKSTRFQNALERESKNPLTKLQSDKDHVRNDAFYVFRTHAESGTARRKEGWATASETILSVIRKHGWGTRRMGSKAKSGAINNIVSEIRTKYMTEITLTQANELLDELEAAQVDYEAISSQQVEVASTQNEPTVSETRPELIIALRSLFQFVGLQQIAAPSEDLNALTSALNELITKSISTLKASDTRAENAKKITDTKPTTEV